MKKIFIIVVLLILGTTIISTAQDTTDPLVDFFENLGFTVEESSETTTETAAEETPGEPPYESSLEPPYCNEGGTDGFAPCGSRYDNECNDGGELEGKCDTSDLNFDGIVEEWEIAYMWEFGWALARYNQGLISREDFPFQSMLPKLPGEEGESRGQGVCLDSNQTSPTPGDMEYFGPINTLNNALSWPSADGSCTLVSDETILASPVTIVSATNQPDAIARCSNLSSIYGNAVNMNSRGFTAADPNWWYCEFS